MDSIQRFIVEMLRIEIHRKFMKLIEEETRAPLDWKGFTGIRPILDEIGETWRWAGRPKKFTPEQFNRMWGSFSQEEKIDYVLKLIS